MARRTGRKQRNAIGVVKAVMETTVTERNHAIDGVRTVSRTMTRQTERNPTNTVGVV
jgi:hypothetical protein